MTDPSQLTLLTKIATAPLKTRYGEFDITVFFVFGDLNADEIRHRPGEIRRKEIVYVEDNL